MRPRSQNVHMGMPDVGDVAPEFELPDQTGRPVRLSNYRGRRVVLYFFPRADTPGCIKEACAFRDDFHAFQERGLVILGVSPDTVEDQAKFAAKYSIPFPLLADKDHQVGETYGAWGLKRSFGREYEGMKRMTFVIDEEGKIAKVYRTVNPAEHSRQLLDVL